MGHHWIPQRYLRNFSCPGQPEFVWLHDKRQSGRRAAIGRVEQQRKFYDPDVEIILANDVEVPTNPVIEKLMRAENLNPIERFQLTLYIGTMLLRVPAHRRDLMEKYPTYLLGYLDDLRAQLRTQANVAGVAPERLALWLANVASAGDKLLREMPPAIIEQIRSPWPSVSMLWAIYNMTWRVLVSAGPQYFITTDNPAFYFGSWGLASEESEISFPLSTTHVLHGSWQPAEAGQRLVFLHAWQSLVKEINRRLVSVCDRAFYHEPAPWLSRILAKSSRPFLSTVRWSGPPVYVDRQALLRWQNFQHAPERHRFAHEYTGVRGSGRLFAWILKPYTYRRSQESRLVPQSQAA
jgi:hypothetical protein